MSDEQLTLIATTPGQFRKFWESTGRIVHFDPPRWIDLSLLPAGKQIIPTPSEDLGSEADTEETVTCPLDGFHPLQHLGWPPEEVARALAPDLRSRAILTLPPILKQLTSSIEVADIVVALAGTPDNEYPFILTPMGFAQCLSRVRNLTGDPPPPTFTYRIRLHLEKNNEWANMGEAAMTWIMAVKELMQQLGLTFRVLGAPYDSTHSGFDLFTTTIWSQHLERLTYPRTPGNEVGTFDMWCATNCEQWGSPRESFPYWGPAVSDYFSTLDKAEITCECRESWPFGLIPCVALVGSDRRDNDERILQEYMSRLKYRIEENLEIPPFQIIYASLWTSDYRSCMAKCVACCQDHLGVVTEMFSKLRQATHSSFMPVTHMYTIHLIPQEQEERNTAMMKAALAQQLFLDGITRVVLTGLDGIDPFTFCPSDTTPAGTPVTCTLIDQIYNGSVINASGQELENPIIKVTVDSANTRLYLMAHHEDAAALIKHSRAFLPTLAKWLDKSPDVFSLDTSEAHSHLTRPNPRPGDTPTVVTAQTTPADLQSTIMSTLASIQQSLLDQGEEIKALKVQGAEIKALKIQMRDHTGRSIPDDMISAVQSSITHATSTWQEHLTATQNRMVVDIVSRLDSLASVVRDLCHEMGTKHQATISDYSGLVEQYNTTATNSNDNSTAYGNELAMMRLNLEACVDRLNWLVNDLGLKPGPSNQPGRTPPELLDMVYDSAYDNYFRGEDMAHVDKTSLSGPCNPEIQEMDTHPPSEPQLPDATTQVTAADLSDAGQGATTDATHSKGRPGTPPPAPLPHGPLRAPPTIPLPPSPGDRKRPPPDRYTDRSMETTCGHDNDTGLIPSATENTTELPPDTTTQPKQSNDQVHGTGTAQLSPAKCTLCFTEVLTTYHCDTCSRVLCFSCTTVALDTELITCKPCARPDDSINTQIGDPLSLTPSDSSDGSSFSQRSTKPQPRRRHVRVKLETSKSQAVTTRPSSTPDNTNSTNNMVPKARTTRRTVQTAIDALLPPRGKDPTRELTKMTTRQNRAPANDA